MTDEREGYEPWVRVAFGLALATLVALVVLGSRPGAPVGPFLYRTGLLVLGAAAALCLAYGIVRCVRRRPALQRKRVHGLLVAVGTLWAASFPLPYPSSHEGRPGAVALALPFEGEATVRWAGDRRRDNLLVLDPARRFGVAFAGSGAPRPLFAPCAGRVVAVGPDAVSLRTAEDEFLVLAGLTEVEVAVGDELARGAPLGSAGPDGFALHLQDLPEPGDGEGIPLRFLPFLADRRPASTPTPRPGCALSNAQGSLQPSR